MGKVKKHNLDEWIILISDGIKQLRKDAGYSSYEDFAIQHDIDRKQYWRIENGSNITIKTLIKILAMHKKDLPSFFSEIERHGRK